MIYIGIDPGKNGGLAILNGEEVQTFRYDRDTYRCVLPDLRGEEAMCCLEHVSCAKCEIKFNPRYFDYECEDDFTCADCACYRCEHLHHCYGQCAKRGWAE